MKRDQLLVVIGAALCLISMLFGYVSFNLIIFRYSINWALAARFLNNLLYAVPVAGVMLLISGLLGNKMFQLISVGLCAVICIWFLFAHRTVLQGDALRWVIASNSMLQNYLSTEQGVVNLDDITAVANILSLFLTVGLGYVLFVAGTVVGLVGSLITGQTSSSFGGGNRSVSSGEYESNY